MRIAALLHVASNPSTAPSTEIGAEPMAGAIAIAEYFIPHALAAFDLMGTDEGIDDARRVLAWIKDEHIEKFTARDAFQVFKGAFKKMTRMSEALTLLNDHQYVHELQAARRGSRDVPQPDVLGQPVDLRGVTQNPQNPQNPRVLRILKISH